MRCIREEVFGPHLALIPFRTNEDAVRIYNDTDYGLSMAVVTEDYRAMRYVPRGVRVRHGLPCGIGNSGLTARFLQDFSDSFR